MRDEEEHHSQQVVSPSNAALGTAAAPNPPPGQACAIPHTHSGTTVPGWDPSVLPNIQFILDTHAETFGYDDAFPMILYEQHPEVSGFNWDAVLPE
jgi:hypothetical protein